MPYKEFVMNEKSTVSTRTIIQYGFVGLETYPLRKTTRDYPRYPPTPPLPIR